MTETGEAEMTDAPETCPDCGTPLVYTGPPIHEEYCPNTKCDRERRLMKESIQTIRKALSDDRERRGYLRGLEDAAKVAERLASFVVMPSPTAVYTSGFVTGVSEAAAAIRALAKEGGE